MPSLLVCSCLPEGLDLPSGEYGEGNSRLTLSDFLPVPADLVGEIKPRSGLRVSMKKMADDDLTRIQKEKFKERTAQQFLNNVNLLIRWYRAEMEAPTIHELTLAQASPFVFFLDSTDVDAPDWRWGEYVATPLVFSSIGGDRRAAVPRVRTGYEGGGEPPIEMHLLMDAKQAVLEGRFREGVLFCWSVIDAVFNQKFDRLAATGLADEWPESRKFLIGNDFGLRHKMTLGLRVLGKAPLSKLANGFWEKLNQSYRSRNAIIHEGAIATEEDAHNSLSVASTLVTVMRSL